MVDRNNFVVTNHTARVAYRMRKPKPYSLRYTPGKGNNLSVYLKHYSGTVNYTHLPKLPD